MGDFFFCTKLRGRRNLYQQASEQNPFMSFILLRGLDYGSWPLVYIYITIQPWSVTLRSYLFRSVTVKMTSESPVIGCSWDITRPGSEFPAEVMPGNSWYKSRERGRWKTTARLSTTIAVSYYRPAGTPCPFSLSIYIFGARLGTNLTDIPRQFLSDRRRYDPYQ